jgi:hypothetical protein
MWNFLALQLHLYRQREPVKDEVEGAHCYTMVGVYLLRIQILVVGVPFGWSGRDSLIPNMAWRKIILPQSEFAKPFWVRSTNHV